jgi:hypothetical protein
MTKQITMGSKPKVSMQDAQTFINRQVPTVNPVQQQPQPQQPQAQSTKAIEGTKRISAEIPESFHRAIKGHCGARGVDIRQELYDILLAHYAAIGVYTPEE